MPCASQIFHDEDDDLQEVEVEDVLALQDTPDIDSESEDSEQSDVMSASDMSDDESEGN